MVTMTVISGIWIAILPHMKWNKMGKKLSFCHLVIGVYTCISVIAHMLNEAIFGNMWVQLAYIAMCILLVIEIVMKFKCKKNAYDILAIVTAILGVILSAVVFFLDYKEISSSIIMVVGSMIILSIPFNKAQEMVKQNRK